MSEAIILRGLERILIVLTAALFGYLGYRLFLRGITDEKAKVAFKSKIAQLTFSGAAPGLIFMAFGVLVLMYALIFGGARSVEQTSGATDQELKDIQMKLSSLSNANPAQAAEIDTLRQELKATQRAYRDQTLKIEVPVDKTQFANAAEVAALRSELAEIKAKIGELR